VTQLLNQIDARFGRSSFFQRRICATLPGGGECELKGNSLKSSGSFVLGDDLYEFDGDTLCCNKILQVNHNYCDGVMGVGEYLSIYSPSDEYLYALRPREKSISSSFILSNRETKLCEITRSYFGMRFTAHVSEALPTEIALLCLWVAMTKMSG